MNWESTRAYRGFIHLEEIRVHAEFLRNAVLVWDALTSGSSLDELPALGGRASACRSSSRAGSSTAAAPVYLQETLNAALTRLPPAPRASATTE